MIGEDLSLWFLTLTSIIYLILITYLLNFLGFYIAPPCCVPTETKSLSMLTVTKKQITTKNPADSSLLLHQHLMNQHQSDSEEEVVKYLDYKDMEVTKCGCR